MHWRPKNGKENKNENKVEKKKSETERDIVFGDGDYHYYSHTLDKFSYSGYRSSETGYLTCIKIISY